MPTPQSRLAYKDCYDLFDQAIADSVGIRVKVNDYDAAVHLRMRMHSARAVDRKDNADTYDEGHPLYGRSDYDVLVLRIRQINGDHYLYLERTDITVEGVESLSEVEPYEEPEPRPLAEVFPHLPIESIKRRV